MSCNVKGVGVVVSVLIVVLFVVEFMIIGIVWILSSLIFDGE